VHIKNIYGTQLKAIKSRYPSITVTYDLMVDVSFTAALVQRKLTGHYENNRVTTIGPNAFADNALLTSARFGVVTSIGALAFSDCKNLSALILPIDSVCALTNASAFNSTPIKSGTGFIYVPKILANGADGVAAYQSATNWSTFSSQIRAIEDWPEICGGDV
jgi:hypothetical protein